MKVYILTLHTEYYWSETKNDLYKENYHRLGVYKTMEMAKKYKKWFEDNDFRLDKRIFTEYSIEEVEVMEEVR